MRGKGLPALLVVVLLALVAAAGANASNPRSVTVMTMNIYQGTELEHVLAATDLNSLVTGVATDYGNVQATDFNIRAQGLAAEIAGSSRCRTGTKPARRGRAPRAPRLFAAAPSGRS
jgi:hypothetical protein